MSINCIALGKRICFYRLKFNITQEKLAALTNCSREYIAYLESGTKTPSLPTLIDLANVLHTEYTSPIIEEFDDPTDTFKDNEFVYTYAILAVVGVVAITFGAVLIEMVSLDSRYNLPADASCYIADASYYIASDMLEFLSLNPLLYSILTFLSLMLHLFPYG